MASKQHGIMHQLPEGTYTRGQVAQKVGRSADTIRRWHDTGVYPARMSRQIGKLKVWLYTDEDVTELRKLARTIVSGPKPKKKAS